MKTVQNLFITYFLFPAVLCAMEHENLAVFDFQAKGVSEEEASAVTDIVRGSIVKADKYSALDRDNVDKILAEQNFQHSSLTDTERLVEMGKLLNVQYIVVGTLSKLGNTFILSTEMINVQTAKIEKSEAGTSPSIEDMIEIAQKIGLKLVDESASPELISTIRTQKKIEGGYRVEGRNPDGSSYRGMVSITKEGGFYNFVWKIGTQTFSGQGYLKDDTLTVDWGAPYPVIYKVQGNGRLVGIWNNGNATETLTLLE